MAHKIVWSPRAVSNLEEICNYIEKDSEYYARLFAKRVISVIENIPAFPASGRIVPEYENKKLREKFYQNYRIVYRIKKDAIEIVAICHGAMMLKNVL
ncbi:MAG: type II toxin-antitoxin system RelE/ParE family toxin [Deltaproteobacteria bacterium]|nr:type II toxin-antitoxin system RelE/ParE family toxin [Deltaproteobacteria bacterium]MCL5277837.1 type II toxin-antitoxin system RelE/ParE family toxin [Deltaproteobacteria bacterium]